MNRGVKPHDTGAVMDGERKRRYYSISDVADMLDVKQHTLRYWEDEFPMLRPRKNRAGNRAYTERDIRIVRLIKTLLHEKKFKTEGAINYLKNNRELIDDQIALSLENDSVSGGGADQAVNATELRGIRDELVSLIEKIEKL